MRQMFSLNEITTVSMAEVFKNWKKANGICNFLKAILSLKSMTKAHLFYSCND